MLTDIDKTRVFEYSRFIMKKYVNNNDNNHV